MKSSHYFVWIALGAVVGCGAAPQSGSVAEPDARPAAVLRVAIRDDPSLQRAIDRLAGEWRLDGGDDLATIAVPSSADVAAAAAEADLVVFPSRLLGELCEADLLRPMRKSVLRSEELRLADFFPAVRDLEIVYGGRVMALPIGCPTPLVLRTGPGSIVAPADDRRLALAYLAWAAPHATHRSRAATLFDADDLRPRLVDPPFRRALDVFAEATAIGDLGAGGSRVLWPERGGEQRTAAGEGDATSVAPPPGADEVYNPISGAWERLNGRERRATLVATSGRLVGVTAASRNAAAAFRLAGWLTGVENGPRLSASSDDAANCRGSRARDGDAWLGGSPRLATEIAAAQAEALRAPRVMIAPRLPGADEYLAALGRRVRERLSGATTTDAALRGAADDWNAVSAARGVERQRRAYARSVNAADYAPAGR